MMVRNKREREEDGGDVGVKRFLGFEFFVKNFIFSFSVIDCFFLLLTMSTIITILNVFYLASYCFYAITITITITITTTVIIIKIMISVSS